MALLVHREVVTLAPVDVEPEQSQTLRNRVELDHIGDVLPALRAGNLNVVRNQGAVLETRPLLRRRAKAEGGR